MTQDEIIEMARQADIRDSLEYDHMECNIESLEAFAKLVAQHEREACAMVCELLSLEWEDQPEIAQVESATKLDCALAIRARGQA
jgi:hypothetical protein